MQISKNVLVLSIGVPIRPNESASRSLSGSVGIFRSFAYVVGGHATSCFPSRGSWWIFPCSCRREGLEPSTDSQLSSVQVRVVPPSTGFRVMNVLV